MQQVKQSTLSRNKLFKNRAWTSAERASIYDGATNSTSDLMHFLTGIYIKKLTSNILSGSKVLDLGCGTGVLTKALAASGYDTTGVDISRAMLEKITPESEDDRLTLWEGDVFGLPFQDSCFDGIITRWVVPHFRDWPLIIKEAARVLKPGGIIVYDQCSKMNYEHALSHGTLDYASFGYDDRMSSDEGTYYASASIPEIQLTADIAGLKVLSIESQSFFRQNAIMAAALGKEGFKTYKNYLDKFYEEKDARHFIEWFELNVTPRMPLNLSNGLTIVCQKPF
jgi:ubiquinone/menaquinone biosynthesis C-methylase UbiE